MSTKTLSDHNNKRLFLLSNFLREIRFAEGKTQEEVSRNLNLHRNTILRAENAKNVTLLTVFKIADEFDIPIYELFQEID